MDCENLLDQKQLDTVDKMHNGCVLYAATGLGKSRTAIYYFLKNNNQKRKLYIITRAKKRDEKEWDIEYSRFKTHQNYTEYVVDSWNNISKYTKVSGEFFIFDEQGAAGRGTWANSFIKIARKNKWIMLSATPGDNWEDYGSLFVANGFFKNRAHYEREHIIKQWNGQYLQNIGIRNEAKLNRLRRKILVSMVAKMKTTQHHSDIMTSYDKIKYRQVIRTRWNPFTDAPIENSSEYCQVLRKIVNSDVSRQVALLELFEKHPKLIVFYNYDYELEILKNLNYGRDVKIAEWNGHNHQEIPKSDRWLYLVHYNAGSEGWNCIHTDTIVYFSENYSYKMMQQSSGRIDRRNTSFTDLYYYHLTSKSSIDVGIKRALAIKKNFNTRDFYNG